MQDKENSDARKLTEAELEAIKAQILDSIYADIGKSVVRKALWLIGAVAAAAIGTLTATGHIKIGG